MGSHQNGSQEDHHYEKYHKRVSSSIGISIYLFFFCIDKPDIGISISMTRVYLPDLQRSNTHRVTNIFRWNPEIIVFWCIFFMSATKEKKKIFVIVRKNITVLF